MRGAWSSLLALCLIACAPAARVAGGARHAAEPEIAVVADAPEAPRVASPSPALESAIAAAVAPEWPWPRSPEEPVAPPLPARPEGHLAHPVCVGRVPLKKERPRKATCCYPAMEALKRPIRAIFPALRACYDARRKKDAAGRVAFTFRVEQDGSIQRVCSGESTSVDDEDAVRCMVTELRKARFPAMSDAEVDLCGLVKMSYPVVFEP